jgi:opacity protein-like surface antigen
MLKIKKYCRFDRMFSRCFFVFVVWLSVFTKGSAQQGFRIGPTAMFLSSRSSVIDSLPDNYYFRYKSGFSLGFSAQYGFTPGFVLASGVSFTSKGYRLFNDTNKNGNLLKHNITNIEVPLNMIFKIRMNTSSNIRGILGVTVNSTLSKDMHEVVNKNRTFIIREQTVNKIYPMLNLGVEIANESKAGNLFCFGVNYRQGFERNTILNVYNKDGAAEPRFPLGFRGSYLGISVTYLFNLKNLNKEEEFFY